MIYVLHHDDTDGIVAAWAAHQSLVLLPEKEIYIPVQYNTPYPLEGKLTPEDTVYVVDFSYDKDFILEQRTKCKKFVVIDHHATASHLADMDDTYFDITKSGAKLSWEYFNPNEFTPRLVNYAQDYDLWKFELPYTKEIQNLILLCGYDFLKLDTLHMELEENVLEVQKQGKAIEDFKTFCIEHICKDSKLYSFQGYKVAMVNVSYPNISQAGQYLIDKYPDIDFSMTYFVKGTREFVFSLRSRNDIHVGEIAKRHGGGGHKNAAGFTMFHEGLDLFKDGNNNYVTIEELKKN